jgi:hypothetical protein
MRRRTKILKRSLLVVLCGLAVASVTGRPAGSSPRRRDAAPPSAARSTMTRSTTISTAPPPAAVTSTPRAVATRFAAAYARYLQDTLHADRLPACSPAARAMVAQSGPLPARLRVTQLRLTAVTGARGSWAARFAILDSRGRGEVSAELVLTATRTGWEVAEVVPPDLDTLIATPMPAARPTGPTAARRAALAFTDSYLAYTYGHAGVRALRDLTPSAGPRARAVAGRGPTIRGLSVARPSAVRAASWCGS